MSDTGLIQILSDFLNGRASSLEHMSDNTLISAKSNQVEPILYYQTQGRRGRFLCNRPFCNISIDKIIRLHIMKVEKTGRKE